MYKVFYDTKEKIYFCNVNFGTDVLYAQRYGDWVFLQKSANVKFKFEEAKIAFILSAESPVSNSENEGFRVMRAAP